VSGGCGLTAFVWGTEPPAFSIGSDEPLGPWDSGFSVLFDDAPDPDDLPPPSAEELPDGITVVCLHCLLDDHPELGRGLDIAREHCVADLDERGQWVAGDLSRL
jgi:hypothetical protein